MDFEKVKQMIGAPVAGLFCLLCLIYFAIPAKPSEGLTVVLLESRKQCPAIYANDERNLAFRLTSGGVFWANQEQIAEKDLKSKIHRIYQYRAERIAYVVIDDDVSMQKASVLINDLNMEVDHTGLITKSVERVALADGYFEPCKLIWPKD